MNSFPAWVEINLDALRYNIKKIRAMTARRVNILLVVKADAYGHGAVHIAKFARDCGIDMFGVATIDEGKQLREAGIEDPILVLSPVLSGELQPALDYSLAVSASSYRFAMEASRLAMEKGKKCTVHVEVDTGMGRAGLPLGEASAEITRMKKLGGIEMEGVFTHFPASDSDFDFTREQITGFTGLIDELGDRGIKFRYVHCANSAAIVNFPSSHFNMVRPGLMAYGHHASLDLRDRVGVVAVMSFKTRLVMVKDMPAGSSVSYGRTYISDEDFTMGVVPVGYGHGLSHRLSNTGRFLFRGRPVPIIGRVTMDMTMIDLSGFSRPEVGDEVVIMGRQAGEEVTVDDIAQWAGTINYEIMCRISKRVVRVYMRDGRVESLKTLLGVSNS